MDSMDRLRSALDKERARIAAEPSDHPLRTPVCPGLSRFGTVLWKGGAWTSAEAAHMSSGCRYCQRIQKRMLEEDMAAAHANSGTGNIVYLKLAPLESYVDNFRNALAAAKVELSTSQDSEHEPFLYQFRGSAPDIPDLEVTLWGGEPEEGYFLKVELGTATGLVQLSFLDRHTGIPDSVVQVDVQEGTSEELPLKEMEAYFDADRHVLSAEITIDNDDAV